MATHSSREGKSPPSPPLKKRQEVVRPRYLISLPRRLRTSAPHILLMSCFIQLHANVPVRARLRVEDGALFDRNAAVGGEIGGNGPTISALAIN